MEETKLSAAAPCPSDCSGNGICANGRCFCNPGFDGEDCSAEQACPKDCSGNGVCKYGRCFCDVGFDGEDCTTHVAVASALSTKADGAVADAPRSGLASPVVIAGGAFVVGLIVGALVKAVTSWRQRRQARAILLDNEA